MERAAHHPVGRRAFLAGAAATALAAAGAAGSGCGQGGDEADSNGNESDATPTTSRPVARLPEEPFRLGVASGDPLPDRVVLWTRLAPLPLAGGLAGMPDSAVDVGWQVATDDRFTRVVEEGMARAEPSAAHSVHVDAAGLDPSSTYWYRFRIGEWTSPVGRTRTAPEAGSSPSRLRLALAACQDFGSGHYAAYRHLLAERVDLVVHLGDYIYEWPSPTPDRPVLPAGVPVTLDDYRLRHASYRSDPDLQAAHARFPFVAMWDDHDVLNNHTAAASPDGSLATQDLLARRHAAYRAYWEHLPLRVAAPEGPDVTLYRQLRFGDLAQLVLLDVRQYADAPPCRDGLGDDFGNCAEREAPRSLLGIEQEAWLDTALAGSGEVAWNLLGSSTVLAGIDFGPRGEPGYQLETWDGYPAARRRLLDRLQRPEVATPVVLSADWHSGMIADVHLEPHDPASPVVCTEVMTPPISSPVYDVPRPQNPHIRHVVPHNGYTTLDIAPDGLNVSFHVLDDATRPDSGHRIESVWPLAPTRNLHR